MNAPERPWQIRPKHQQRRCQSAAWRHADQQRANDAKGESPHQDLHPSEPIGETASHDDEDAREQGRDRHGDIHDVRLDPEVGRHRGRNVESGLGKQPEGQHSENDAEK